MLLRVGAESVGVCLGVPVVHPRFARIHGAACVAFFFYRLTWFRLLGWISGLAAFIFIGI